MRGLEQASRVGRFLKGMRRVSARAILTALPCCAAAGLGCRAPTQVTAPSRPEARTPDTAHAVAQEAVDGRVTMLLHVDRLQGYRFSQRLISLGGWNDALAGTGVDPLKDVHRAFVAARSSHEGDVALVLQHSAPEDKVAEGLAKLQRTWESAHAVPSRKEADLVREARDGELPDLSRFPFPAAYRTMNNDFAHIHGTALLAEPHPGLIVVVPPSRAFATFRFMESGGLPEPRGDEAMVFRAWDPTDSIQSGPLWSRDVRYAELVFAFDGLGSSVVQFRAVCTSPETARTQAQVLTHQVDEAQSVSFGGSRLRLFDYIEFHADKDRVKMKTNLMPDDVDWIVAMSMK